MTRTKKARPGVTLIEILIVVAIIGVLMALTAAALQKTAEGQKTKSSTDNVFKLQQALDMEYERIVQKCDRDATTGGIPQALIEWCDGDLARAKAVWTAGNLRVAFPETFAEANATLNVNGALIRGPAVFRKVQGATGTYSPQDESGVLLYLILAERSVMGGGAMATAAEDLTQASRKKVAVTVGGTPQELEAFTDAWGHSIGFKRWYSAAEVQATQYAGSPNAANSANRDPLDNQNLVLGWSNSANRLAMNASPYNLQFTGQNRVATVYSVGKDKTFNDTAGREDNILGFKLRRQGELGRITK